MASVKGGCIKDDEINYPFMDLNDSEVLKGNILIVDEIFQNLKDIRELHSQKKDLSSERKEILERSREKRFLNAQSRFEAENICKSLYKTRHEWEDQRETMRQMVLSVGRYIKQQERYLSSASKMIRNFTADIADDLLSTKMEYSLDLARKQVCEQPVLTCLSSKRKHEKSRMRRKEAEEILQKCEQLKNGLKALCEKPPPSENPDREYVLSSRSSTSIDSEFSLALESSRRELEAREEMIEYEMTNQCL